MVIVSQRSEIICWPMIFKVCHPALHQASWSMISLSGVHFVPWARVHLHVCSVSVEGRKKGMCSIPRATWGALFCIYLHYSCQSTLLRAKWAKWIFCSGANVIWKAGLCAQSVGGYSEMERVPVCEELGSSALHLLLSPRYTPLYTAAKTPTDKTLT